MFNVWWTWPWVFKYKWARLPTIRCIHYCCLQKCWQSWLFRRNRVTHTKLCLRRTACRAPLVAHSHWQVLEILWCNKLFLKPEKCNFKQSKVEYLGVIIGNDTIQIDPRKVCYRSCERLERTNQESSTSIVPGLLQLLQKVYLQF